MSLLPIRVVLMLTEGNNGCGGMVIGKKKCINGNSSPSTWGFELR